MPQSFEEFKSQWLANSGQTDLEAQRKELERQRKEAEAKRKSQLEEGRAREAFEVRYRAEKAARGPTEQKTIKGATFTGVEKPDLENAELVRKTHQGRGILKMLDAFPEGHPLHEEVVKQSRIMQGTINPEDAEVKASLSPLQMQGKEKADQIFNQIRRLKAGDDPRAFGLPNMNPTERDEYIASQRALADFILKQNGLDKPVATDPVKVAAKGIAGGPMEMAAMIGGAGGGPELVAEALYGPGAGEEAKAQLDALPPDMLDRLGQWVALTPEEEENHPVAKFVGNAIGTMAVAGPAASGLGTVAPAGSTVLGRGIATAMELQPELFFRISMGLESGTLTQEQALEQWALGTGMGLAAGTGLGTVAKATGSLDAPTLPGEGPLSLGPDVRSRGAKLRSKLGVKDSAEGRLNRSKADAEDAKIRQEAQDFQRFEEEFAEELAPKRGSSAPKAGTETELDRAIREAADSVEGTGERPSRAANSVDVDREGAQGTFIEGDDFVYAEQFRSSKEGAGKVLEDELFAFMRDTGKVNLKSDIQAKGADAGKVVSIERNAQARAANALGHELPPPLSETQRAALRRGIREVGPGPDADRMQAMLETPESKNLISRSGNSGEVTTSVTSRLNQGEDELDVALRDHVARELGDLDPGAAEGGKVFSRPVRNPDGSLATKHAGNINLEKIGSGDRALQNIYDNEAFHGVKIAAWKGPRRQWSQVKSEAAALLRNPERVKKLLQKGPGSAFTDTESFALREIFDRSAVEVSDAFDALERAPRGSAEFKLAEQRAARSWSNLVALQGRATGLAAEAGRTLNAMKIITSGKSAQGLDLQRIAQYMRGIDDPEGISAFVRNYKPTLNDKLHELWVNSLVSLSDPVNISSNTAVYLWEAAERGAAGGVDFIASGAGTLRPREVFAGEAVEFLKFSGARTGLKYAWDHMKTGKAQGPARTGSKFEHREAIGGKVGDAIRIIGTRKLSAEDEFFAHINYQSEVQAQAYRHARNAGLKGKTLGEEVERIMRSNIVDPGNEFHFIHEAALNTADRNTFVNQTLMGQIGGSLKAGAGGPAIRWLIPFSRVGSSIVTRGIEASPIGFATGGLDVVRGNRGVGEALARPVAGSMLGVTTAYLHQAGLITGSRKPTQSERETLWANGWQENSFYLPGANKWVAYDRLEPMGMIIGNAVDALDALKRGDLDAAEKFALIAQQSVARFKDSSWMRGVADAFAAMDGDYGVDIERWAAHTLSGFAPKLVTRPLGQVTGARGVRPEGFFQHLQVQLGVKPGDARIKVDPYGLPIDAQQDIMDKMMATLGVRTRSPQPNDALAERTRVGQTINRVDLPTGVDKNTGLNEKEMFQNATPGEVANFMLAKGQFMNMIDNALIKTEKYQRADDDQKATMLSRSRSFAAEEFHDSWRKGGRKFDARSLNRDAKRIREERLLRRITLLTKVGNLTKADLDRLASEAASLEIINGTAR